MTEPNKTFGLEKNIQKAAALREMCQHPGFKILHEAFESKIKKITARMLDAETSDEEASKLRKKLQVWTEIEKMLNTMRLTGELSRRALDSLDTDLINASPKGRMDKEN